MAEIKDMSIIPALVTVTNLVEDKEVFDAGTKAIKVEINKSDLRPGEVIVDTGSSDDKVIVKRKYMPGYRNVQMFKTNNWVRLEPGDSLKVYAYTSAALSYWMSLNGESFKVVAEKAEAAPTV